MCSISAAVGLVLTIISAVVFTNNKIITEWVIPDTLSRKCNIDSLYLLNNYLDIVVT